jgi:SAM-dependent methyltransferase
MQRWLFEFRYLVGNTPWDSGITPPEVLDFLRRSPPGRALDLGCGTGTSSIELSRHGWEVLGIDRSFLAIQRAKRKAQRSAVAVDFRVSSVKKLLQHKDLGVFDLILDIGCFHSLMEQSRQDYSSGVKVMTRVNSTLLMYGFFESMTFEKDILPLFQPEFRLQEFSPGDDKAAERASAWVTLIREAV